MTRDQADQLLQDALHLLDGRPHSRYVGDALDRLQRILDHYDYYDPPSRDERLIWYQRRSRRLRQYIATTHDRLRGWKAQWEIEAARRVELSRRCAELTLECAALRDRIAEVECG